MQERKDNEQQNIIIFQAKACVTEIDNLTISFTMNVIRKDDHSLIRKT